MMKVHDLSLEEAESELNARPFTAAATVTAAAVEPLAAGIHHIKSNPHVKSKRKRKAKRWMPESQVCPECDFKCDRPTVLMMHRLRRKSVFLNNQKKVVK